MIKPIKCQSPKLIPETSDCQKIAGKTDPSASVSQSDIQFFGSGEIVFERIRTLHLCVEVVPHVELNVWKIVCSPDSQTQLLNACKTKIVEGVCFL